MTVDEAKDLKSGNTVHDTYFNRLGEVIGTSKDGFTVRYGNGDSDEEVLFAEEENVKDFDKIDLFNSTGR